MSRSAAPVVAVLLAAGESARLGRPKQLLPFRGRTLLRHAAETALASGCDEVYVVIGAAHERMRPALDGLDVEIIVNSEWREGLGGSIRHGIRAAMQESATWSGAMLLLADQPLVTPVHLQQMLALFRGNDATIIAARYDAHAGPPVVIGAPLFPKLLEMHGPSGARSLIASMPADTILFDLPEAAVDIDVPADERKLYAVGP